MQMNDSNKQTRPLCRHSSSAQTGPAALLTPGMLLTAALLTAACSGEVSPSDWEQSDGGTNAPVPAAPSGSPGEGGHDGSGNTQEPPGNGPTGSGGGNADDSEDPPDPSPTPEVPVDASASTRAARLTHLQYDNAVSDLLYLTVRPSVEFPPDPVFGGYDNNINQLRVADRLGRDYRRSAEALAQAAVTTPDAYAQLVACEPSQPSCLAEVIATLGLRAYRRPLTPSEQDLYTELFEKAPSLVASGDAFRDGVQLLIEAMLQSPKFLYRLELSGAGGDTPTPLSDHELAQRLSFTLWNTTPDDSLLESAASGALTSGSLPEVVARMVDDPRARGPVSDFHFQWLKLNRYADLQRDAEAYPLFSPTLPLQEEVLRFVEHIGFEEEKGYLSLMTAPKTFVNRDSAALYGVEGDFGEELELVDLDPQVRGGLLTQIGFLAANAYPSETSPIHRGVFINRTLLCKIIPDPPSNLDIGEEAIDNPKTTREAVEQQTSPSACSGCHALINPAGFAFESFDAVGQVRALDRGQAVDTTGALPIDGEMVSFTDAKTLIEAIARSEEGRLCFARNLLRYAYGRTETPTDDALIQELAEQMSSDDFSIKNALSELAQAAAFTTHIPNQD